MGQALTSVSFELNFLWVPDLHVFKKIGRLLKVFGKVHLFTSLFMGRYNRLVLKGLLSVAEPL